MSQGRTWVYQPTQTCIFLWLWTWILLLKTLGHYVQGMVQLMHCEAVHSTLHSVFHLLQSYDEQTLWTFLLHRVSLPLLSWSVQFLACNQIVTRNLAPRYTKLLLLVFQYCLYMASLIICKKKEQCTHHFVYIVHNFYPKQNMGPRLANSIISSQSMPTLHFYKANLTLTFKRTMHPSRVE